MRYIFCIHCAGAGRSSQDRPKMNPDASRRTHMATKRPDPEREDANRDPITGEPGAHPVGTGVGAALGGAAAGAAAGAVGGPAGAAVGAVVGGIAGGFAGKAAAESIDPTAEEAYWRENYPNRPYYEEGISFYEYAPAYRYGWESRARVADRSYDETEAELREGWESSSQRMDWDEARPAVRDAWDRIDERFRHKPR